MRRHSILILALLLAVAGCSGSDDAANTTTAPGPSTTGDAAPETATPSSGAVAQDGDIVSVHYIGTLDDGSQFDSSYEREPLTFEVGTDQVIAGFDEAVHGMAVGDKKTVRIPAEDAYGPVDEELIFRVPIEQAPDNVAVGDEVLIDGVVEGRVTAVGDTEVTIDTNHRYAGQALTFEIELVGIN
jgi:FKBP-type peptidyl-prolyl cis-trans isomerase 2